MDGSFTQKRTSCFGKDLGWRWQDRPGDDLTFVVSRSHLCARGLYTRQRALKERATGALAPPGWKSVRTPWLRKDPWPGPARPKGSATISGP